jgi:hypothetical protein
MNLNDNGKEIINKLSNEQKRDIIEYIENNDAIISIKENNELVKSYENDLFNKYKDMKEKISLPSIITEKIDNEDKIFNDIINKIDDSCELRPDIFPEHLDLMLYYKLRETEVNYESVNELLLHPEIKYYDLYLIKQNDNEWFKKLFNENE